VIAMTEETQSFSTHSVAHAGAPVSAEDAARALRDGPIGAYIVAGIAVGLLFLAWLAFYFLLFLPRGAIG
jgi:asparagine N-glycosylation enzyme membrane subunit Stt3